MEDCNGMEWNGSAVEFELLSHALRISFFVSWNQSIIPRFQFHFISWNVADEKLHNLCNNEITRGLTAVKNRRFVTIPFSATTLGVRIGSVAWNLAEAVRALTHTNAGLSSVQFTEVSFDGSETKEALGTSGAIVYTRLPVYNNIDLESFCPGGQSTIFIDDSMAVEESDADEEANDHDSHDEANDHDSHDEAKDHDSHDDHGDDHDHDHGEEDHHSKDSSAAVRGWTLAIAAGLVAALV